MDDKYVETGKSLEVIDDAKREVEVKVKNINEMSFKEAIKSPVVYKQFELILPKHVPVAFFTNTAIAVIANKPKLLECSNHSIVSSILEAAGLGLHFAASSGLAYLVPYKGICTFMPGYRGFAELAYRTKKYESINAQRIHSDEVKKKLIEIHLGSTPHVIHRYDPSISRNDTNVVGVYAVANFIKTGNHQVEVMDIAQLAQVRGCAKSQNVWNSHLGEMQRKSVIRRLFKSLECSREMQYALEKNDQHANMSTEEVEYKSPMDTLDAALEVPQVDEKEDVVDNPLSEMHDDLEDKVGF